MEKIITQLYRNTRLHWVLLLLVPIIVTILLPACSQEQQEVKQQEQNQAHVQEKITDHEPDESQTHRNGGFELNDKEHISQKDLHSPRDIPVSVSPGLELANINLETLQEMELLISNGLYNEAKGTLWLMAITFDIPADVRIISMDTPKTTGTLTVSSSITNDKSIFSLNLAPEDQTIYLNQGMLGFLPDRIYLTIDGLSIVSEVSLQPDALSYAGSAENVIPIPSDPEGMLLYQYEAWRQPGYELFAWNIIPNILIFDFGDYALQRRFFARLAFFVGVVGESGQVHEETYYEGRHVFNAHDYRPEDMAAFFNLVREEGLSLNHEEKFLKQLAINNDILHKEDNTILPGEGAILSIAREIPASLRRRLLTHEAMHGLFYAVPEFREGCFEIWHNMSELEQHYWNIFLGNKGRLDSRDGYDGYEVSRLYLLVNEMMAHILQLTPNLVDTYFIEIYLERMLQLFPEEKDYLKKIPQENPDLFRNTRTELEELLFVTLGLRKGNIYTLSKINK